MHRTARPVVLPAFAERRWSRSMDSAPVPFADPPTASSADGQVCADRVLFEEKAPFGSLFVVHLGEFYRLLGGRTRRTETSLRLMGEMLLRNSMESGDTFAFHAEGFFEIRLNGHDRRASRRRAEEMTDDLGRRAVGERFLSWRSIHEAGAANDDWSARDEARPADDDDEGWVLGHRDRRNAYAFAAAW